MRGVRNHLYWCVTSTVQGFEELISAKWKSFMGHIRNKHTDHPNSLFSACAHEEIAPRQWIKIGMQFMFHMSCSISQVLVNRLISFFFLPLYLNFSGTKAYDKITSILASTRLLGDIKKLSPDTQTSCLEGFHATLNHWHPKMLHFSWLGTFCRYM